ncbi:hypothetical protein [Granulosicoccus antarcticus]|uniref:Malate synthase G n=1 Tax=Granulosicoccus antarcticus IMCC3135 TaxID=1192854 RepID=A0A2Z2NXP7_9GAMM|nr:hypothetical protein [Granulosicoccus antarcticus]ASJ72527.1 Malate synthase G [Granulosicoccus antarcticus IMCC3135]
MGTNQPFRTSASWEQSVDMLDSTFPLSQGSHGTAIAYLVHFEHLVVIQADGTTTSLKTPSQFLDAGGNPEAPQSILLGNHGIQVEIEPATRKVTASDACPKHRMQLLTSLDA